MFDSYFNPYRDLVEMPDRETKDISDEERQRVAFFAAAYGCATYALMLVLLVVGCVLFGSCTTTEYVVVPEHHADTIIVSNIQRDSIYVHDSVSVAQQGDTVTIEKWHTKYVEREVHDTCYQSHTDTIAKPYPVEVKVEKELSTWQSFRMTLGTIALCMLAVYVVYRIIRKKLSPPAL